MGFINDFDIGGKSKKVEVEISKKTKIDYDDVIPESERINLFRKIEEAKYVFDSEDYPNSINFYDFEGSAHHFIFIGQK